jgi:integrase/recombinase XerD
MRRAGGWTSLTTSLALCPLRRLRDTDRVHVAATVSTGDVNGSSTGEGHLQGTRGGERCRTCSAEVSEQRRIASTIRAGALSRPSPVGVISCLLRPTSSRAWTKAQGLAASTIERRLEGVRLRAGFIMAALDAGVPLRDVQIAARHADPRTTTVYDRRRENFDRHAAYVVVAHVPGG